MAKIIWLASYPKSGNTWMRILINNYWQDGTVPADINKLDGGPIASARTCFDELVGVEASALEDTVIERLRPDVYRFMAAEAQKPLYMKVHDAWKLTDRQEAIFPADITAGVIYIMRNPLDLAAACANHWGIRVSLAVDNLCNPDFIMSKSQDRLAPQLRQRIGSWSSHVQSWLDDAALPVHIVRYEDLHRDTYAVFRQVVCFCKLPYTASRVRKAVAFSDFAEMRRQEQSKGFRERMKAEVFFRRGQVGAWREELSAAQIEKIVAVHGPMMQRFGYLDKDGRPL